MHSAAQRQLACVTKLTW